MVQRLADSSAGWRLAKVMLAALVGLLAVACTAATGSPSSTVVRTTTLASPAPPHTTSAHTSNNSTPTWKTSTPRRAATIDRRLLLVDWLMVSVEYHGLPRQDVTGYLPVVVELTASWAVYDTDCGGTLNAYSAGAGSLTIGALVVGDGHGCVAGFVKGPGPDAATALFYPGTVIDYRIDGDRLTLQTPEVIVAFRRNGPIRLGSYYPELTGRTR